MTIGLVSPIPKRKSRGNGDSCYTGPMAVNGLALLKLKAWSDTEPVLRESLTIREKRLPDSWMTFNAKSMVGGALLGRKQYAQAEPLLVAGYAGMKQREAKIPNRGKVRLIEALERLIQLYEARNSPVQAGKWKVELKAMRLKLDSEKAPVKPPAKARKPKNRQSADRPH